MKSIPIYLTLLFLALSACKNHKAPKKENKDYGDFEISSYTPDTLYRFCGNELQLLPKNTTDQYSYFVRGAKLKAQPNDPMTFWIEPYKEKITLHVIKNENDTSYLSYISINIPDPILSKKAVGDSIDISAIQPDKKILKLLPNDCEYLFRYHGGLQSKLRFHKEEVPDRMPAVFRKNYEGEMVPTRLNTRE
ncbi:hypothetical protein [Reichenbachiella ulvae]|uniref:Lipoprotein n=1 Tax=Reichenbachiella ulvae TaxID=2980104 RepID=A0ABT3CVE3_9BACT|nr:hypothetical protein [Reichenbachiella ulvae]MCV9387556.1 hypothetical protein [Reichenbachiella ulvae]